MDLLKIKIKDTMARVTLREYLDSHDIMYFTKKKSVYVKPETGNTILSYLDLSGVEYDSKFKDDVDITNTAFKVFQPTEEVRNILQNKKTDIPTQTQDTVMDNAESENKKEESAEQEDSFDDEVLRKIDAGEALTEKEIRTLVLCGYAVEEIEHSVGRWERQVSSIVEIKDRYFSIDWSEGLTEIQENTFDDFYPEEVESYEETVVVKKWRPIEKTKEEAVEETEEELEL